MSECTIVAPGESFRGVQGLDYGAGISAQTAGAQAICMHRLTLPPGARARAHLHEEHESTIYVISGRADFWWGPRLEHHAVLGAGDFLHIPAGVPHVPANIGDVDVEAVLARTDPNEQESVVTLPELDGLAHLPPLPA
ncbi:MAG TPA: cupin domain-containing protein [Solirubrobacteraceae bacterium]|nr:cupin domain-containing protein [Solirubrobacteraceae bacterium]